MDTLVLRKWLLKIECADADTPFGWHVTLSSAGQTSGSGSTRRQRTPQQTATDNADVEAEGMADHAERRKHWVPDGPACGNFVAATRVPQGEVCGLFAASHHDLEFQASSSAVVSVFM